MDILHRGEVDPYVRIGDRICLHCNDTEGYIFCEQTCSMKNNLYVFHNQHREKPENIANPHVVTFRISKENRYKLTKKYRQHVLQKDKYPPKTDDGEHNRLKELAQTEHNENEAEWQRLEGKPLLYGDIIQLNHGFTNKYLHVDTKSTSKYEKSKLKTHLVAHDAKEAQFRILPKYKVNSEGEKIHANDQVIFESLKAPGQYLHASPQIENPNVVISELNVGAISSSFTVVKRFKNMMTSFDKTNYLWGGAVVQLQHKHLEGYLDAQDEFVEGVDKQKAETPVLSIKDTETSVHKKPNSPTLMWYLEHETSSIDASHGVHLRIRASDNQSTVESNYLHRPNSCTTYWQVEGEHSIINGEPLQWAQHVRIRHLVSRKYLYINPELGVVGLHPNGFDPNTVFKIHSIHGINADRYRDPMDKGLIEDNFYIRLEHVLTGRWIHGEKDEAYQRKGISCFLKPDPLRKVSATENMEYQDAFSVSCIPYDNMIDCNFVIGMLPLINDLREKMIKNEIFLYCAKEDWGGYRDSNPDDDLTMSACVALSELEKFVTENPERKRVRKSMIRQLKILDMLKEILGSEKEAQDEIKASRLPSVLCSAIYDLLFACVSDNDVENSLHLAQYLDFFQAHISKKESDWQSMVNIMTEIVRDKKEVIARIKPSQIEMCIALLKKYGHPGYVPLLRALCVCNGVANARNQRLISQKLLKDKQLLYKLSVESGTVFLWKNAEQKVKLSDFLSENIGNFHYVDQERELLREQLKLFLSLVKSRNEDCIRDIREGDKPYITWEVVIHALNNPSIAEDWKAYLLKVAEAVFIDSGKNTGLDECIANVFDVNLLKENVSLSEWMAKQPNYVNHEMKSKTPAMQEWILNFLGRNPGVIASMDKRNFLVETSLSVMHSLLKFGYMEEDNINALLEHVNRLMGGSNDLPTDNCTLVEAHQYRVHDRYLNEERNDPVVAIKWKCVAFRNLLVDLKIDYLLERFVALFVHIEEDIRSENNKKGYLDLARYLHKDPNTLPEKWYWMFTASPQKKLIFVMKLLFTKYELIHEPEVLTEKLLDLSKYKYDHLSRESLKLIYTIKNIKSILFEKAKHVQLIKSEVGRSLQRETQIFMPLLERLISIKDFKAIGILERFISQLQMHSVPYKAGQNILLNYGLLPNLFSIIQFQGHVMHKDTAPLYQLLFQKTLIVMKEVAKNNADVQENLYNSLDQLLELKHCKEELADTLKEIFRDNATICWKVQKTQVRNILHLAFKDDDYVPNMLKVLQNMITLHDGQTQIRRNQTLIMQQLLEWYPMIENLFDAPASERFSILLGKKDNKSLEFFINIINLIVLCSRETTGSSQSFSQNIMNLGELVNILNNPDIHFNLKRPFVKFISHIFIEAGTKNHHTYLKKDRSMWDNFLTNLVKIMDLALRYINDACPESLENLSDSLVPDPVDAITNGKAALLFVVDTVLPFLQGYFKIQKTDTYQSRQRQVLFALSEKLKILLPLLGPLVMQEVQQANIKATWVIVALQAGRSTEEINNRSNLLQRISIANLKPFEQSKFYVPVQDGDLEKPVNEKLMVFVDHVEKLYTRSNTLEDNLIMPVNKKLRHMQYIDIGNPESLPLSDDFLVHLKAFIVVGGFGRSRVLDYQNLSILTKHLRMSSRLQDHGWNRQLDIRCLQIIRAAVHQLVVNVPTGEYPMAKTADSTVQNLTGMIDFLIREDIVSILLDLMSRKSSVMFRETLALLNTILHDANPKIQAHTIDYFLNTREEVFFMMIKQCFAQATELAKERKFLRHQLKKLKDRAAELHVSGSDTVSNAEEKAGMRIAVTTKAQRWKLTSKKSKIGIYDKQESSYESYKNMPSVFKSIKEDHTIKTAKTKEESLSKIKDDGTVSLILKVVAKLCDGQYARIQNYMREQPDNLRSYNVVVAIMQYLGVLYTSLTPSAVSIMTDLFQTLTELCSGNQENRIVILDNKIIDYLNFLIRSHEELMGSSESRVEVHLFKSIANLLIALMEESGPEALKVAKDISLTLDINGIIRLITALYRMRDKNFMAKIGQKLNTFTDSENDSTQKTRDLYITENGQGVTGIVKTVGTKFYIILARLYDVKGSRIKEHNPKESTHPKSTNSITEQDWEAIDYFMSRVLSIEIIKDSYLQRIYFPVSKRNAIREELRETMKWNIDRSSPSNKIQDFMQWSDIIIRDFYYHQRVLSNPISRMLTSWWKFFNFIVFFLSVVLNMIMLSVWRAPYTVDDIPKNATKMPAEIYDETPITSLMPHYDTVKTTLAITHNVFSFLVLGSYFLTHNPKLPTSAGVKQSFIDFGIWLTGRSKPRAEAQEHMHSGPKVFSFLTLYYLAFVATSVLGTIQSGYLFSFHLFHIVLMVDLLRGVIKAVTVNGKSLIWVAILGIIMIYVYGLIGFAQFRPVFRPDDHLYCSTLYECVMTIMRYGMAGDIVEVMRQHELEQKASAQPFINFTLLSIYQLSFFIFFTTIGLNIIFGIIVDTFSELRDTKWRAAKDMQELCFICGIPSYKFEYQPGGFYQHVHHEHNMWSYIYYFIYLSSTNPNDYTSLDVYVSELREKKNHDFFPFNRAFSLAPTEEDNDEAVITGMAKQIEYLVQKSKEHEIKLQIKSQDKEQNKWKKKAVQHKRADSETEKHPPPTIPIRPSLTRSSTSVVELAVLQRARREVSSEIDKEGPKEDNQ